jgi:hypothetical protein
MSLAFNSSLLATLRSTRIVLISDRSRYPRCTFATLRYGTSMGSTGLRFLSTVTPPIISPKSPSRAQTQPSGKRGSAAVSSGAAAMLLRLRRIFWPDDPRSARMRARRSAPVSVGRFVSRQSRVSSPVTAALSSARRQVSRPWRARCSAASPSSISAGTARRSSPRSVAAQGVVVSGGRVV